jgi:hypothetical protein
VFLALHLSLEKLELLVGELVRVNICGLFNVLLRGTVGENTN